MEVKVDYGKLYECGNDITEAIKIALASYATGDKRKPLIIDSHSLTQKYIANTSKTMESIATNELIRSSGIS